MTPQFDCYAISIKSNGGLNIAGTVTVNYNDGNPTATITANGADEVFFGGTIKAGNIPSIGNDGNGHNWQMVTPL